MKTPKQGIIIAAIVTPAGLANAQARRVRTLKHYIRKSILGAFALAALCLFSAVATAATVDATYNAATDVPVTASNYTAAGSTVNFTLNFAPDTGTEFMVVSNTGLGFINGTFDNLTNGQPVALSYGENTYSFVANYYGGSGNDLVLVWANNRAFAWGSNQYGQLGDNTTTNRLTPVPVMTAGALANKTVVAIAASGSHSLALCSDGTVAAWGYNASGQLGDNTSTQRKAAVVVNTAPGISALSGKTVAAFAAGGSHSLAQCADGTFAAWGYNSDGELGDNTKTNRLVPVAVNTTALAADEPFIHIASGSTAYHNLALAALPPAPKINLTGNGLSITNGAATASPADGTDFGSAPVASGSVVRTFTIQNIGTAPLHLTGTPTLAVSGPQAADFTVTLQPISPVASSTGTTTLQVSFAPTGIGRRMATLSITNDDAAQTPYTFAIQGTAFGTLDASYTTGNEVPVTTSGFTATSNTVNFSLNFAPAAGTELMVVKNIAPGFINGTFDNLTNRQPVALSYGGTTYNFVANYYGGSGNDLVLIWANNRVFAWGMNQCGQLGDNTSATSRQMPMPVTAAGVLAGKTVVAIEAGNYQSLALCLDGTVAAWGWNGYGQLGDNTTTNRLVPVAVNAEAGVSALCGKTVVAIAAGAYHSLALCSDGTVAAWGDNDSGQLGDNTTTNRLAPVAVNTALGTSALYGKTVVAIAAGFHHSLAVCLDGTVAAWGADNLGQLGNNYTGGALCLAPAAVSTGAGISALYGKTVVTLAAGYAHSLALCSDGTVAAWGFNGNGQLGSSAPISQGVPVAVNTASGVSALYGKTVTAIAAGWWHSLALCSDGTVAAWGYNVEGELGDNAASGYRSLVPVAVNTGAGLSALYGKTVVSIAAGYEHSLALCSEGTVAAWGYNNAGQLGDNTTANRFVPVAVNMTPLAANQRLTHVASGSYAYHTLALVGAPPASETTPLTGAQTLTNGSFQFTFTNTPGAFFGVLATTNPALPLTNWSVLDGITEVSPGQFQFTDPEATNSPQRFYRVRSPGCRPTTDARR